MMNCCGGGNHNHSDHKENAHLNNGGAGSQILSVLMALVIVASIFYWIN
jgi:hypothetical protein